MDFIEFKTFTLVDLRILKQLRLYRHLHVTEHIPNNVIQGKLKFAWSNHSFAIFFLNAVKLRYVYYCFIYIFI